MPKPTAATEVTFTERRRHTKTYFDAVESGGSVRVTHNGKPIAEIVSIKADILETQGFATQNRRYGIEP